MDPKKLILPVCLAAGLGLAPLFFGFRGTLPNLILHIEIYIILALGLNVVVGYTGLLDLGYATFMAIGAVVTCMGLMLTHTPDGDWVLPFGVNAGIRGDLPLNFDGSVLLILLVAGLVAAIFGVLRGIPTLRLTGDYYAIVTLGIAEIMWEVFKNEEAWTGGSFAVKIARRHRAQLFGESFNYATARFYYLVLAILVGTIIVMRRLQYSRLGRAWAAIRLDETAARCNGVNLASYKMTAFALSGFVGGVGGGLYAIWLGSVAVNEIDIWQSILILCVLVLGGLGSIRGIVGGGTALVLLGELPRYTMGQVFYWVPGFDNLIDAITQFRIKPEARFLVYGLVLPSRAITTGQSSEVLKQRAAEKGPLYHLDR